MSFYLANDFSGGSNGTAMTTGNTGGLSGNAFDAVTATVPNFSNAQWLKGPLAAAIQAAGNVQWSTSITGSPTTVYSRAYVLFTATPTVVTHIPSFGTPTGSTASGFWEFTTAGKILTSAKAGTQITSTTVCATNTLYRVECKHVVVPSGTCTTDCSIFLGDSTSPLEVMTQATGTGVSTDTAVSFCKWGSTNATTANTVFFGAIVLTDIGPPGPLKTPGGVIKANLLPQRTMATR